MLVPRSSERALALAGPARPSPTAAARPEALARAAAPGARGGLLHEELEVILGVDSRTGHLRIAGGQSWVGMVPAEVARRMDPALTSGPVHAAGARRGPALPGLGALVDLIA